MSLTAARFRELVAGLPETEEGKHHGHPDFRVRKKIFATLSEDESRAALRLPQIEARALSSREPEVYRLVSDREPYAWVSLLLAKANADDFSDLLEEAWRGRAPDELVARL